MTTFKLDFSLDAASDVALKRTATKLGGAIREGFSKPVYSWPGVTKRRSGELAGRKRNVIDTGALRDSQTEPQKDGAGYYIEWTAPYAAAVFLGAVFKNRKGSLPARNLPMNVVRDFDLAKAYTAAWNGDK